MGLFTFNQKVVVIELAAKKSSSAAPGRLTVECSRLVFSNRTDFVGRTEKSGSVPARWQVFSLSLQNQRLSDKLSPVTVRTNVDRCCSCKLSLRKAKENGAKVNKSKEAQWLKERESVGKGALGTTRAFPILCTCRENEDRTDGHGEDVERALGCAQSVRTSVTSSSSPWSSSVLASGTATRLYSRVHSEPYGLPKRGDPRRHWGSEWREGGKVRVKGAEKRRCRQSWQVVQRGAERPYRTFPESVRFEHVF